MTRIRHELLQLLLLLSALVAPLITASSPATRLSHFQSRQKHAHPSKNARRRSIGSLIRLKRPTAERVSQWFPSNSQSEFNHKNVGMTNPCLHIDLQMNEQHEPYNDVIHVSADTSNNHNNWWPSCPSPPQGWKTLRLCRRVGWGTSCYNAVRDKALEWEWSSDDESCGIVQIHSSQAHSQQQYQRRDSYGTGYDVVHNMSFGDGDLYGPSNESAVKIWNGPGGRRLATYTRVFSKKWLPRIYNVNPVNVVYDLVDQRGPFTTYTSTAYATCKGHWLRGEERLTVAHRDDGDVDIEIVSYSHHGKSLFSRMIWPFVGPLQGRFFETQMKALQQVAEQHSGNDAEAMGATMMHENLNVNNRRGPAKQPNVNVRRW